MVCDARYRRESWSCQLSAVCFCAAVYEIVECDVRCVPTAWLMAVLKKKSIHINNSPKCTSGIHTYKLQYKLQAVERRGLSPRGPPAGRRPRDPGAVGFARREGFIAGCQFLHQRRRASPKPTTVPRPPGITTLPEGSSSSNASHPCLTCRPVHCSRVYVGAAPPRGFVHCLGVSGAISVAAVGSGSPSAVASHSHL